jgi:hypothetical protein
VQLEGLRLNDAGTLVGPFIANDCGYCEFQYANGVFSVDTQSGYPFDVLLNNEGDLAFRGFDHESETYSYLIRFANGSSDSVDVGSVGSITAMNDSGWVVGSTGVDRHGGGVPVAFLRKNRSSMVLGAGAAYGINNAGDVVGTFSGSWPAGYDSSPYPPVNAPFLSHNGNTTLLTRAAVDPAWTIRGASSINAAGQILVQADDSSAAAFNHSLLMTPRR